ncbi:MAG: TonB-dependent receptor [Muribaculum sp.]
MRGHNLLLSRVLCGSRSLLGVALLTVVSPAYVHADTITGKVHRIQEVTVSSRRSPIKVSSAIPVQTLSGADISQLGIQNMADAVRRFAGANVRDYGGIGGLKTVSVRNMGAAHTAVSYDGAPVSNCQAGQIDIGRFSLDNVAMLSLAVGQNDDMLQAAKLYASAAVLGIRTERPVFDDGRSSAFRLMVKGGSFGYVSPSFRWWQKFNDRLVTSVDGNFLRADGNYPFKLVNGKYVTTERRNNSAIDSWHSEANMFYSFPQAGELQVKGYYFYSKRGLPGAITLYNPVSTETLWDKNAFMQMRYSRRFSRKWELQVQGKYNYGWNRDREFGPQFTGGVYNAVHKQNEYYLSATGLYRPLSELTVAFAQDGVINTLRSTMVDCPYPDRYTSLSALSMRWQRRLFTVTGTLVGTYITETVKEGERPDDIKRLSPSLSVNVQPWSDEMLFFRAMYKSTFRTPSFNDLYYYRLGNRTLRPEKADEFDVGITWSRSLFPAMDYMSVTVDAFYNDVTDKIVAFPTTYAWRMVNFGKVHVTGADVTLASAFSLTRDVKLMVSGAYTWQRAVDLTDSDSKTYKDLLPYTPEHSGNASCVVETPWVNVGYSVVAVGKRYFMSENIPANEIDGYAEHTLTLSRELDLRRCRLKLQGEIVNLTDCQYDVIKYYPMPGRSWRITGTFTF